MQVDDFLKEKDRIDFSNFMGSDCSVANLFLLKDRYNIHLTATPNCILRQFDFSDSIQGFAYPFIFKNNNENGLNNFFSEITKEKAEKIPLCLFSELQKNEFQEFINTKHPEYQVDWSENPADNDYIYLQKDLADLQGKSFQKKRNHLSKFHRAYKEWNFVFFTKDTFSQKLKSDFLEVAQKWIDESVLSHGSDDYLSEKKSVEYALNNFSKFDFSGGILYIEHNPIAVTLASPISTKILDIHFEKCLSSVAENGGYAAINNFFAKECTNYTYINREEDLGIEGLRKAKFSYKPALILKKYSGNLYLKQS